MSKILEVNNLQISFRTNNGTVKAVRNISFDLNKGETLSIVGESGSGKSVTSKAILGISAGNAIIDGGEILYDGRDLLKISEEEMHKLRGDKIAMIFQDPLSSLDPIVKIGKQITEAMLLKNKASRKMSRKEFNKELETLRVAMIAACAKDDKDTELKINQMIKKFDNFNIESLKLQTSYNLSKDNGSEVLSKIEDFLFKVSKKQQLNCKDFLKILISKLNKINDSFYLHASENAFAELKTKLNNIYLSQQKGEVEASEELVSLLKEIETFIIDLNGKTEPNFFRIGFYLMENPDFDIHSENIEKLNEMAREYLDQHFMLDFIEYAKKAISLRQNESIEKKKNVILELEGKKNYFAKEELIKKETKQIVKELSILVRDCVNELDVNKDTLALTFGMSVNSAINAYFTGKKDDAKDAARFEKQTKKRDALIAKGKQVDWKVVPRKVFDEQGIRDNIVKIIDRTVAKFKSDVENAESFKPEDNAVLLIDWFKEKAFKVVEKITKTMAKEKAIQLMEEVGIPEPRIRFYQYPFEFSGGMRQRIVIAIALAANPEILICDEPTTALDVTIQAQILDLINKLKKERNLSIIFITHDLGVVANMADRIAVMYAGKIVEYGTANDIFYAPAHPYTWALLSSMPDLDTKDKLDSIPGTPPNMIYPPVGDAFAARNKYALKIDFEQQPPLFKISDTHYAATWLLHPNAPKVEMPKVIKERIERMKQKAGEDYAE